MTSEDERISAGSMGFLAFLTVLNVLNFVDRQLLASFAAYIKPDLALTDTQFGLLTGLFFLAFYSIAGVFMGTLADRTNRTRLIAIGLAAWSALTALSGAARGFWTLAIPRMFIGVGESIMTPSAMSLLSDKFPQRWLGFASGFYYMGVPIGVGVSLLVAGYLGPAIGWRNCFYLLGGIGIVFAAIMLFFREPARRRDPNAGGAAPEAPSLGELLTTLRFAASNSPALALTIGGGVVLHFILGAATFDQLWYVDERGFDKAEIARISGYIGIVGGVLGNLFGGVGGDLFMRRTGLGRPMFLFWIMLAFAPFNVAYRIVDPDSIWFYVGIFIGFFQLGAFYGPTFSTVQELVPVKIRATVVACYLLLLNLVGVAIGVTLGGVAIDIMRSNGVEEPYTWTLLVFTVISLLSIPLFYMAGQRYQRDKARLFELVQKSETS